MPRSDERRLTAMAGDVERHERVRADWLLAHEATWHLGDRRMAEELRRAAATKERAAAGAAESSHHEARIKPLHARFVAGGEEAKEKAARGCLLFAAIIPALALTVGPALALSQAVYTSTTERQLRRGSVPVRRPWLIGAAAMAAIGLAVGVLFPDVYTLAVARFYPETTLRIQWLRLGLLYGWWQVALGLALVAWQVRRHGWPGVTIAGQSAVPTMPTAAPRMPEVPVVESEPEPEPVETTTSGAPTPPRVPKIPDPDPSHQEAS